MILNWAKPVIYNYRADSKLAPSQWETSLRSNAVSRWLGTKLESALQSFHPNGWLYLVYFTLHQSMFVYNLFYSHHPCHELIKRYMLNVLFTWKVTQKHLGDGRCWQIARNFFCYTSNPYSPKPIHFLIWTKIENTAQITRHTTACLQEMQELV